MLVAADTPASIDWANSVGIWIHAWIKELFVFCMAWRSVTEATTVQNDSNEHTLYSSYPFKMTILVSKLEALTYVSRVRNLTVL